MGCVLSSNSSMPHPIFPMLFKTRKRRCLVILIVVVCFFVLDCITMSFQDRTLISQVRCDNDNNKQYIEEMCHNYSRGLVSGSLCPHLCTSKDIKYIECLGHKDNDFVMLAKWKEEKIILKGDTRWSRTIKLHFDTVTPDMLSKVYQNTSQFKEPLMELYNLSSQIADRIISECDSGHDNILTYREAIYCWRMIDKDEFMISFQLENLLVVPRLYGTCGTLFGVEFVPSTPFNLPLFKDSRSWDFRAKLAISLIELVEKLEKTDYGTLYLCDVQEGNFGVVEIDGQYVVKSIDNDISFYEKSLLKGFEYEKNNNCTTDDDCGFIDCEVKCDHKRGKCSGIFESNNLQILCKNLFIPRYPIIKYPLLHHPPSQIQKDLKSLLHQCTHPIKPSIHISWTLANKLKRVLRNSLQEKKGDHH